MAGPRATALRVTWLYVSADPAHKKSTACRSAAKWSSPKEAADWLRVYANTDIEEERSQRRSDLRDAGNSSAHLRLDAGQGRGH